MLRQSVPAISFPEKSAGAIQAMLYKINGAKKETNKQTKQNYWLFRKI